MHQSGILLADRPFRERRGAEMDDMGIELQNLLCALSGSGEGQANHLLEPFSSILEGLEEKRGEIPLIGPKGGEIRSPSEEKGIHAWEVSWEEGPFLFFSKEGSLRGTKRPGVEQVSMDISSNLSRKKDLFREKKNNSPQDEIRMVILGKLLDLEELLGEVSRGKEAFPFKTRLSDSELWSLKASCSEEAISQLNAPACGQWNAISGSPVEISKDKGQEDALVRSLDPWAQIHGKGEREEWNCGPFVGDPDGLAHIVGPRVASTGAQFSQVGESFPFDAQNGQGARGQQEIRAIRVKEATRLDASARAVQGLNCGPPGLESSEPPGQGISHQGSLAELAPSGGHYRGENQRALPDDSDGLARIVGPRVEIARAQLSQVGESLPFDTQNGQGAREQEESLGQAKGHSSCSMEVAPKETSEPGIFFEAKDSRTEASQEGPLSDNGFSVSPQGLKTLSAMKDSPPEFSLFPLITEEKRSREELATFKGPRREGLSIKREVGQAPEMGAPDPASLFSKEGLPSSPSGGEKAELNDPQRLHQLYGRELAEGPFQTVQIVFKEDEDLTRIRLRLHQNNLDALFVVNSAEKKSELQANLGQLQRELSQSGFLPQLAVEVGGRYGNSAFQKDPPIYPHQKTEAEDCDIPEEIFYSGWNPLDGSIHLTV